MLIKYSSVSGSFKVTYVNKSLLTNSEEIDPIINPIIAQYVEVLNKNRAENGSAQTNTNAVKTGGMQGGVPNDKTGQQ